MEKHKAENDDMNALKVRSVKNYKTLLQCSMITALVAAFDANAFNDTKLLKSYLADWNRSINFHMQTNQNCHGHLTINMACVFVSFTPVFSYLCSKKQTHCTYVWRHKDDKAQQENNHVATRLPRL